jgi:tetratricopeptide (TPR) repeat protein
LLFDASSARRDVVIDRFEDALERSIDDPMNALALVMIVRDEARSLERCLESARAWVDEIVVVDTGSSDATPEIASRLGARVGSFAWCDDFSAARNAALALAEAPWRLVLDADEWIVAGADSLAALRGLAPEFIGQLSVASVFDDAAGGVGDAPSWLPRLLPRGVRYAGRVHEQPDSMLPRRRLELAVAHDGYLDLHKAKKAGRNERLLTLALAEAPDDAYLHYQLGKDRELRSLFATALPHYERALAGADAAAGWRHDLVVRTMFTLKKLGRFESGLALAESEMPRWQGSPDFFFTLGDLLLDFAIATPARATELLPMIEASWLRALEIGEQPQLNDTVRGRGSFLAAHNLALLYDSRGDSAQASHWRERAHGAPGPGGAASVVATASG